ncbi:MAG: hypothetical protein M1826_000957 [Phylliscum demangeonii]|nr:MAG: hypothetical protein M1826_000957 [Phylliscum demangeonii]
MHPARRSSLHALASSLILALSIFHGAVLAAPLAHASSSSSFPRPPPPPPPPPSSATPPTTSSSPLRLPFTLHDALVAGTGALASLIPASLGLRLLAHQHRTTLHTLQTSTTTATASLRQQLDDLRQQQQAGTNAGVRVDARLTRLEQVADVHTAELLAARNGLWAVDQHLRPLQAAWVRALLAAHHELWACVDAQLDLARFDYHRDDDLYWVPLDDWRRAVDRCRGWPGWTPDLAVASASGSVQAIAYEARRPDIGGGGPSWFVKAKGAVDEGGAAAAAAHGWLAHAARQGQRFVARLRVAAPSAPALVRAAAKVERERGREREMAAPVLAGWAARVAE